MTHEITVIPVPRTSEANGGNLKEWTEYLPLCEECGPLHPARGYYYTKKGARSAGVRHQRLKEGAPQWPVVVPNADQEAG